MSYIGLSCCNGGGSSDVISNKYYIVEKSSNFTAEKFKYYVVDTRNNSIEVSLPSPMENGDWIGIVDKFGKFSIHNLIVKYNSVPIRNNTDDLIVDMDYVNFKLLYNDNNWNLLDMSISSILEGGGGSGGADQSIYDVSIVSGTINTSVGNYYLVDTSSVIATINLPINPSNGDWFIISDKSGTFATRKATLKYANSKTIANNADDVEIDFNNAKLKLVYFNNNWDILNHS